MNKIISLSIIVFAVLFAGTTRAEENVQPMAASDAMEVASAKEVGNKICPVSHEKTGEMGEVVQHEYNGKIYNLCCKMCLKDFNKDPEKYSKIAEDEVAKAAEQGSDSMDAPESMNEGHDHDHK